MKKDEMTCPQCGQRMRYDARESKIVCGNCGYAPLDAMADKARANPRPHISITHRGEVNARARSTFWTGHDYLHRGDRARATAAFKRAAEFQPDFVDAYLWLAQLAETDAEKRRQLSMVLALDPSHPQALRALMVLNGQLTPEQAAQTYHYNDQQVRQVEGAVNTSTQVLLCPICSGNLTVNEATGEVKCRFCGHTEQRAVRRDTQGAESLAMALIARKVNPVRWVVGQRLLHCNECGAQRTIPATKLSDACPFCGSTHVILKDALDSFEQPDGLVRFTITEEEAQAALRTRMDGMMQRFANLFDNNRIRQATVSGLYLPFWVFDATVEIAVTRTYKGGSQNNQRSSYYRPTPPQARIESRFNDALFDVPVCAVKSPPQALTRQLLPYDLNAVVEYDSRLLAKHPAELYSIDFDKASLEARSVISHMMRDKHRRQDTAGDQYEVTVFSTVQSMSFRLLLLPVWVVSIIEEDGDQRSALINGQTARVALGKTEKRKRSKPRQRQ